MNREDIGRKLAGGKRRGRRFREFDASPIDRGSVVSSQSHCTQFISTSQTDNSNHTTKSAVTYSANKLQIPSTEIFREVVAMGAENTTADTDAEVNLEISYYACKAQSTDNNMESSSELMVSENPLGDDAINGDGFYHNPSKNKPTYQHKTAKDISRHPYVFFVPLYSSGLITLCNSAHINSQVRPFRCELAECRRELGSRILQNHQKLMHNMSEPTNNSTEGPYDSVFSTKHSEESKHGVNSGVNALHTNAEVNKNMQNLYDKIRYLLRCKISLECGPARADNMDHLRGAAEYLKEMAKITDYFQRTTTFPAG